MSSSLSSEFFDLIKAIGESKTKQEEDRIIVVEIQKLKKKVGERGLAGKKLMEFLIRMIYVEMLGHDASFGYMKAVELCTSTDLLQKRVGYLTASLCLSPDNELRIMLVNRLQKDMQSTNVLEVCAGLIAASKLLTADMIPAVQPLVENLLGHDQSIVRKKAVMLLHRFQQLDKSTVGALSEKFRRVLCDKDPAVMGASLHIFHDVIKDDPAPFKDLVSSFVSILKQITEHRLPDGFDYHRMPAPWIQLDLLRILAMLGRADKVASEQMYEVLLNVMKRSDTGINVGYAIMYEAVKTVTAIYPNTTLLDAAAASIARFITSENHNLKYLGITGLAAIVRDHPKYAGEHQMAVIDALQDPDETLKRKTLDLLYRMINPVNVQVITAKLLEHLAAATDKFLRADLVTRIAQAAERFAPSNSWYIDTILRVMLQGEDLVKSDTSNALIRLIAEGAGDEDEEADKELRIEAVEALLEMTDKPSLPDTLLQALFWVLGEYGYLSESTSLADIADAVATLGGRVGLDSVTRGYALTATAKLAAQLGQLVPAAAGLVTRFAASRDAEMAHRCLEILRLAGLGSPAALVGHVEGAPLVLSEDAAAAMRRALPVDAFSEDVEPDVTLTFLDTLVDEALEAGAKAYVPPHERGEVTGAVSAQPGGLKFEAYDEPDSTNMPGVPGFDLASITAGAAAAEGTPSAAGAAEGSGTLDFSNMAGPWGAGGLQAPAPAPGPSPAPAPADSEASKRGLAARPWDAAIFGGGGGSSAAAPAPASAPAPSPTPAPAPEPPKPKELTEKERLAQSLFGGMGGGGGGERLTARERAKLRKAQAAGGSAATAPAPAPAQAPTPAPAPAAGDDDLDIFGGMGGGAPAPAPAAAATAAGGDDDLFGLGSFGGAPTAATAVAAAPAALSVPSDLASAAELSGAQRAPASGTDTWLAPAGGQAGIVGAKYLTPSAIVLVGWLQGAAAGASVTVAAPAHVNATVLATVGGKVSGATATFASGHDCVFAVVLRAAGVPAAAPVRLTLGSGTAAEVPLRVSDTLRPAGLDQGGFGGHWTGTVFTAQGSGTVPCAAKSLDEYAGMIGARCGLGHVASIPASMEEIAASSLMGTQQMVLVHSKLDTSAGTATLTIKTADNGFTGAVANEMAASLT